MNTLSFIRTLTALLLCFAGSVAWGQSASKATFTVDVRPGGNGWEVPGQQFEVTVIPKYEQSGPKYTPNGCGVFVTPVIDGSSPNYVKQIRYNGQVINVPDGFKNRRATNGAFSGAGEIASFQVSVNINGVNYTKELGLLNHDFDIPLDVPPGENPNIPISNFKILSVTFEDAPVKRFVDEINGFNDEKEKKERQEATASENTNNSTNNQANTAANTSNSGQLTRSDNATAASTTNPYMEQVKEYNAKIQADSKALDAAADQTIDGWANALQQGKNADFITPSKSLVQEFANQGNAAGAYGTIGVAVGAQVISMLGSGKSAEEKAREKLNDDLRKQIRSIETNYKQKLDACRTYINNFPDGSYGYIQAAAILRKGGDGVEKDVNTAFLLAKRAVELIYEVRYHREDFYLLGLMYYTGEGTEKNYEKAFECFKEAEKRRYTWRSLKGLNYSYPYGFFGYMTFMGQGTTKDEAKGLKILKKYHGTTKYILGRIYYEGMGGVSKDLEQAKKYFVKAAHSSYNENPESKRTNPQLRAIQFLEKMHNNGELGSDDDKIMKLCKKKKKSAGLMQDIETIFFAEEN